MSEISRSEAIKKLNCHLKNNGYCDCEKCSYETDASIVEVLKKAISDMEKLEKIEQAIPDIEHLEELMIKMFEEWDCFKEHSYFEKLGIGIFSEGMQTVGYILDCLRD